MKSSIKDGVQEKAKVVPFTDLTSDEPSANRHTSNPTSNIEYLPMRSESLHTRTESLGFQSSLI